ncbi:hypothetical protein QYS62_001967 [Fusarium acuminatum]|uniref:Uncharacterized protein n=1 Tax=Fusarium acuminatum TaxID=5515 RepID=A0ABZ2WLA5_9HYPO
MSSNQNNTLTPAQNADLDQWIDEQLRSVVGQAGEYHFDNDQSSFTQEPMDNSSFAPTPGSEWEESFQRLSEFTNGSVDTGDDPHQDPTSNTLPLDTHGLQVVNEEPRPQSYLQQEVHQSQVAQPPPHQAIPQLMHPYQQQPPQAGYFQPHVPQPGVTQPQMLQFQSAERQAARRLDMPCLRESDAFPVPNRRDYHPVERQPKRIRISSQLKARDVPEQCVLTKLKEHKREYQGFINSPGSAAYWGNVYLSLARPESGKITNQNNDDSFPKTNLDYQNRIREVFEAICDWSNPRGWRAKMGPAAAKKWMEEIRAHQKAENLPEIPEEDLIPPVEQMPPVEEQWRNVIHYDMSDFEIELLGSRILRKDQNKAGNDRKRTLIEKGGNSESHTPIEQGDNPHKRRRV